MQKVPSFEPLESRLVLSASLAPVAVGALAGNVAATTEPVTTRPPTPTGLHVTLVAPRGARLEWADVAGETGYAIERRIDGTTDAWARVGTTAADVTHFAQDGLTAGKTYLYRVRALNGDVASEPSAAASVKIPGEATTPAAPHLEVSLVAPRAAKLTWTNVAGETGYRIERRVDGSSEDWREIRSVGADVTTITDDGLVAGKTYLYRVRAFNAAGNSPYSNTGVARVAEAAVPTAPRELRATVVSKSRVDLKWVDSTGEKGYRVERRVDGADAWAVIGTAPANATSFSDSDTGVVAGKTYQYRVRAFNDVGNSPYSNTAVARVTDETTTVPAAPHLEASLVAPHAAKLTWTNVANETGYRIERRVDGSSEAWREIRTVGRDVTTITDDGLAAGKTYLYRLRAFNAAGNSAYSNVAPVRVAGEVTRPAAPRELTAKAVAPTQINLHWVGVDGETGYRIERRLGGTDAWEKVTFVGANVTSFSDTHVLAGKTYQYRVRAQGTEAPSAWSNTASATTPAGPTVTPVAAGVFSTRRIVPLSL